MTGLIDSVTGEMIDMVWFDGNKWHKKDVDLNNIAKLVGTSGKANLKRAKHLRERKDHKKSLLTVKKRGRKADRFLTLRNSALY